MTSPYRPHKRKTSAPKRKPKPWQTRKAMRLRIHSHASRRVTPRVQTAIESAAYNEGRVAALTGGMCPYVLPESRRQWQAGFRDQMESGPASSAGEGNGE